MKVLYWLELIFNQPSNISSTKSILVLSTLAALKKQLIITASPCVLILLIALSDIGALTPLVNMEISIPFGSVLFDILSYFVSINTKFASKISVIFSVMAVLSFLDTS